MEWYWWILIAAAILAIAYVKLKVLAKWMENRKRREEEIPEDI
jgi:hypothetical protein